MADGFAQSVKQQADIVRIVGEYVRLTKAGAQSYKGLCPFHKEKTPSFNVHATQQFFHCFGCGQSGDVFTFVQKMDNLSFPEAVRAVAQKCGIPLPRQEFSSPEEARESRLRKRLLDAHEFACHWFEEQLQSPEGARAREYLTGRGVTAEAVREFHIGYAPDSFSAMRDAMQGSFEEEVLRASGLFSWKEQPGPEDGQQGPKAGPIYARFRKRVTFPIRNEAGRVIAFTARALESGENAGPKYLNSPETPLYTKGNVLFNLDKAKQAIRQFEFALLVEGQMDCISVYMAGIPNVLATSGTAFTDAQVRLLARYTKQVILNFDPDTAGANAAEKTLDMLVEGNFSVKVVTLDGGLDPDRYIREHGSTAYSKAALSPNSVPMASFKAELAQTWVSQLRGARNHIDYFIERARTLFPPISPDAKVKAINFLLPHIQHSPNRIVRDEFAADAAQKLGIDSAVFRQELRQAAGARRSTLANNAVREMVISGAEKLLLLVLAQPGNEAAHELACERLAADPALLDGLSTSSLLDTLRLSAPGRNASGNALDLISDTASRHMLAALLMDGPQSTQEISTEMVEDALHALAHSRLERRQRELRRELAEAEVRNDAAQVQVLMAEKLALDRALRES